MDDVEVAAVCALIIRLRKRKRKIWVHPIYSARTLKGQFSILYSDLRNYPNKFFNYSRMSVDSFDRLLTVMQPVITKQNTVMRMSVPAEERLLVTIRYLATGNSFYSLSFEYLLSPSTVRSIVRHTCDCLWKILQPMVMASKTEEDWEKIADEFYARTNFPNVIGAIDGKHVRVKCPEHTGSSCFNYKKFFSLVLMAWVDADYKFVFVDIGSYGSAADPSIFRKSEMGMKLENDQLNIPPHKVLPNDVENQPMPFVVVGDEAFGLSKRILRPYPKKNLTAVKRIFNYRHTRARRMVECAFGILASKWRIFFRPLDVGIEFCDSIIKACCVLHNYVREHDGIHFQDTLYECNMDSVSTGHAVRGNLSAIDMRNYFAEYFTSPQGAVSWQYDKV